MFESRKELVAYISGFLDGEGSFIILFDAKGIFSARVTAGQADQRPLELLLETFGGRIFVNKRSYGSRFSDTIISHWVVTGPQMYKMLIEIRPYLIVKAEQADCLLALQESIYRFKGQVGRNRVYPELPKEEMLKRAHLYNLCKKFKETRKHSPAATTEREGVDPADPSCDSLDCIDGKDAESAEMTDRLEPQLKVIK